MNYTARQAFYTSNQVLNNFEAVYTHVAFMCMETIQRFSEFHYNRCCFPVPEYIIGFAVYDREKLKKRLLKHLRSLEYKVRESEARPFRLKISWKHIAKSVTYDGRVEM